LLNLIGTIKGDANQNGFWWDWLMEQIPSSRRSNFIRVFTNFRLSPFAFRLTPFAFRLTPYAFRLSPYALRLTPYAFRLTPFAFRLTAFAFRLTPYSEARRGEARQGTNSFWDVLWDNEQFVEFLGEERAQKTRREQNEFVSHANPIPCTCQL
jgi:hypothetical protein